eukprot:CAMPEP_0116029326 /NCGR_PEP_ID=MMETSP0321-20121206/16077_1 /TAXON_ID=163516 /ORGANISM="Leptocylindrus danicus var. danicus, Strain B650" /LENGTH=218 /DNA_ID=CAMNT_0003503689 /DNA_START=154 /DNA_END=810 /DNA_ORIENTATION=-
MVAIINNNSNSNSIEMEGSPSQKKRIIIKHVVGKVRTSFALPEPDFVFGIPNKMDEEGAGKVLESWAQSEPSKPQTSMRNLPATNVEALKNGCLTAKEYATYVKKTPVMKHNPKSPKKKASLTENNNNGQTKTFGIKSIPNDVPIDELLKGNPDNNGRQCKYTEYICSVKKKGRLPPARPTKSSRLLHSMKSPCDDHPKEMFKMKKFLKVPAKVGSVR